jgi:hypothetical protein
MVSKNRKNNKQTIISNICLMQHYIPQWSSNCWQYLLVLLLWAATPANPNAISYTKKREKYDDMRLKFLLMLCIACLYFYCLLTYQYCDRYSKMVMGCQNFPLLVNLPIEVPTCNRLSRATWWSMSITMIFHCLQLYCRGTLYIYLLGH